MVISLCIDIFVTYFCMVISEEVDLIVKYILLCKAVLASA